MATDQTERPQFFEGQFLSADDLAASVDYARFQQARHRLGAHTWGIAVGLRLVETDNLSGGIDVTLEPGYAVDGFGRVIVVTTKQLIEPSRIANLPEAAPSGAASVLIPVWLRYLETATQGPSNGFAVCETDDQRARVIEDFEILVGRQTPEKDDLSIAGAEKKAIEGLRTVKTKGPLLCDESIPFQVFPEKNNGARWLIPLGFVHWEPGLPGALIKSNETVQRATRRARHYLGVVAETVNAADGIIRLRDRATAPPPDGVALNKPCDDQLIQTVGNRDIVVSSEGDVSAVDLVWVEGNLRVVGDAKLFGGKLSFSDAQGNDGGVPMQIRRVETSVLGTQPGDLQILIGESGDGHNRLVVGALDPADNSVAEHLMIYDDGKVGIRTSNPITALARPLTIRGIEGDGDLIGFEDALGASTWHINQMADGNPGLNFVETPDPPVSRLFMQKGGNVGIGTTAPAKPLTVRATGTGEELLGFEDPGGTLTWHVNQNLSGSADGLNFVESGVADGRLFLQAGGNVGIGTTTPQTLLHLVGGSDPTLKIQSNGISEISGRLSLRQSNERGADVYYDGRDNLEGLAIETFGGTGASLGVRMFIKNFTGRVGIGTTAPQELLDVRGEIRLGGGGNFFALGCIEKQLRVIAGHVDRDGNVVSGDGFTSGGSGGDYTVSFNPQFSAPPVVVASLVEPPNEDNFITLLNITRDGFELHSRDFEPGDGDPDLQESAFTFIALGVRA